MKIKRLRLAGFGPFKTEQLIDFERFDADGIFLITGKTGAGKSSILDALCFALYGRVPRFEGGELRLRSDHCEPEDPTFVELDFSVNGTEYRVYRSPKYERAKKRGGGTTTSPPAAELSIRDGADWRGLSAKPVDVGHDLNAILPLKEDQFLQVILLAQNRFQTFLLAKTEERRAVLRTLFGTARFERLEAGLTLRRKALDDELATVQRGILDRAGRAASQLRLAVVPENPGLDWFRDRLDELDLEHRAAGELAALAAVQLDSAAALHQALEETGRRQGRRDAAATRLAALDGRRAEVTAERATLQAAGRAARVWPQIRGEHRALAELEAALAGEADAHAGRQGFRPADADPETHPALRTAIDGLLGRLGSLDGVLADERTLPALETEIAQGRALLERHDRDLARAQQQIDALPHRIEDTLTRHAAAAASAGREGEAGAALERAELALAAAESVVRHEGELAEARRVELAASSENTAAAARYEAMLARRFAGYAAELAAHLVPGEPCAVCGSAAHPAPRIGDGPVLTEGDLERCRADVAARQQALALAHTAAQGVDARLAQARATATNRSVGELEVERSVARATLRDARASAERCSALAAELTLLRGELAAAHAGLGDVRAIRDDAATGHTERSSRRELLADRVSLHRGSCGSVTELVDELEAELGAARTLDGALDLSRERRETQLVAAHAVTSQLAEEGFGDESAALAARLSEGAVEARESAVRGYDDEVAAARSVLAEPELVGLPAEPVDREPASVAFAAASVARDEALTLRTSLGEREGVLRGLVAEVGTLVAASVDLLALQAQVRGLADAVRGEEPNTKKLRLENYVLAAQLEDIVAAANTRLRTMTSGRYTLEHDDSAEFRGVQSGLGLGIRDEHTGRTRATQSLSGGETFLASLALALGLAEVVTAQAGGITLDTLFVDEGFGSLDSETLETAMGTLDTLRAGGRTIGLISHVDSMKEQIPATLSIIVTDQGHSVVADTNE